MWARLLGRGKSQISLRNEGPKVGENTRAAPQMTLTHKNALMFLCSEYVGGGGGCPVPRPKGTEEAEMNAFWSFLSRGSQETTI